MLRRFTRSLWGVIKDWAGFTRPRPYVARQKVDEKGDTGRRPSAA